MISVGSREGRKVLEQGYSSNNNNINNKRDNNNNINININNMIMEESEIEEGEACSYHDDDSSIDPDVALSYIDEKLQNVLGHFKKDFEGTVSAESLGAKFGTYGSFLPAYRRSPQSRSPPRVQNHHTPQSPGTLPPEGGLHNSVPAANAGHSIKHGYALVGSVASNAHKPPSQKNQCVENAKAHSAQSVEESAPRFDPKTLKVRIKLGSDNLSVKKNAALYTGLGLDGSPSSFEASPMRSEGLPRGLPFDSFESPAQILQMMTSSPLHGGRFLSPLPEDLMQLSERPKRQQDVRIHSTSQSNQETFAKHSSYPVKDNMTFSEEKNLPSSGKKGLWLKDQRHRNDRLAGCDFALKDSDVVSCEELVSDALKLPLLADPDSIKRVSSLKENAEFDEGKRDLVESSSIYMGLSVKPNEKVKTAEEITDASHEMMAYSRNVDSKSEIANNFDDDGKIDLKSIHTSEKDLNLVKQRTDKSTKYVDGILPSHGKEKLSSGGKKRKRRGQSHGYVAGTASTGSTDYGVLVPKDKENCDTKHTVSRSELEQSSLQKDLNKTRDAYVDIFGDMNDQDSEAMDSPNLLSRERLKAPEIVEKATLPFENPSKERASSLEGHTDMNSDRKTSMKPRRGSTSIRHLNGPSHNASVSENGCPISEATLFGAEPDEWVCCDQCQKWRLLPPGRKAADLPDSWICSMQTWLPDMNSCSFSDEVTNEAIRVRFQMLPEVPNSLHVSLDRLAAGSASADILNSAVSTDGKLKTSSRSSFQDSSRKPSLSQKKQQALKGRTVTEAKEYLLTKDQEFQHQTKSSDLYVNTNQYKKVRRHQHDSHSDGGNFKSPKIKSKREYEQDFPRTSKRSKTRSMQSGDNSQATSRDQVNGMLEVSSAYGLTADTAEKDMAKYSEPISSCILKDMDVKSHDTLRRFKGQVDAYPATESVHMFKSGSSDISPKKRKGDSIKDPPCSTPSSGKLMDDNDEFSRKRHRMSKSEGRESGASKRNGKADKKSKIISQRILNLNESFQKDSSVVNVAATSSSSKVSGSLKVKSKFQEVKGSPVESVSSSPLRNSNFEKRGSGCRGILEKDIVQDAEKMMKGSPRKFVDDIHEVGDGLSWPIKKEEMETGTNKKALESSMINVQNNGDSRADCKELDKHHSAQNSNRNVNGRSGGDGDLDVTCGRDKYPTSIRNSGKGKFKMSQSYENLQDDVAVHEERARVRKIKEENSESNVDKSGKDNAWSQEPSFRRCEGQQEHDEKRSKKMFDAVESGDLVSASLKEKSKCLLPSDGEKCDTSNNLQHCQGIGTSTSCTDAHPSDKEPWVNKKADSQTGNHLVPSKHSISNEHRIKDQEAPSPLRRDSSSHAASYALKEAKNLKHMADRVKNVDTMESIGLYFEAALKFLHGASLLESGKPENFKQRDVVQAMKIYRETAELCRFCAHEYEKSKDMATAALAYKCMEVAYMRVVYSSHSAASRDRCELQTVLHMVPSGESPSSSASDIDNLNNIANGDVTGQAKSADSPLLSGNLVIAAKNRPNFSRLLKFAEDMNAAMEASRRSRIAFAAANDTMNQADPLDCIASIKRALDFNFHDVEGLLRLVRLAKDAVSR